MMPGANYVMYGCPFARTASGVSLNGSLTLKENVIVVIIQGSVIDDNLERQIKNRNCRLLSIVPTNLNFSTY